MHNRRRRESFGRRESLSRRAGNYYKNEDKSVRIVLIIVLAVVLCLVMYFLYDGCEKRRQQQFIEDIIDYGRE